MRAGDSFREKHLSGRGVCHGSRWAIATVPARSLDRRFRASTIRSRIGTGRYRRSPRPRSPCCRLARASGHLIAAGTRAAPNRPKRQRGLAESQQAPARSYCCSPRKAGVSSSRSTSLSKIVEAVSQTNGIGVNEQRLREPPETDASGDLLRASARSARLICLDANLGAWRSITNNFRSVTFVKQPPSQARAKERRSRHPARMLCRRTDSLTHTRAGPVPATARTGGAAQLGRVPPSVVQIVHLSSLDRGR
jgi:hypothetical protein